MKSKFTLEDWGLTIAAIIMMWLVIGLFSSCSTSKRIAQAKTTLDEHPKERAEYCGARYPPIIKYLPGKKQIIKGAPDTVDHHDTVQAKCPDNTVIKVPCPPSRTIHETDTLYVHDTMQVENTAVSEGLHYALVDSEVIGQKATDNAVKWRTRAMWGISAAVLLAIIFGLFIWGFKARKFG